MRYAFVLFILVLFALPACRPCGGVFSRPTPPMFDSATSFKLRFLNSQGLDLLDPNTPGHFYKDSIKFYSNSFGSSNGIDFKIIKYPKDTTVYLLLSDYESDNQNGAAYFRPNLVRKDLIYSKTNWNIIKTNDPCNTEQYKFNGWNIIYNGDSLKMVNTDYYIVNLK